jgi:hypothetical protein
MDNLDYESLYNLALKENIAKLQKEIDTKQTQIKIGNWAKKFKLDPIEVRQKIIDDYMFSLHFIIDPSKQSIHEEAAANYINQFPNVEYFENLPGSGENALVINNGKIISKKDADSNATKTIDFEWESYGYKCYASHKHTKDVGGAQDNQYKDLRNFMENIRDNNDTNIRFFAICDGDYYQNTDRNGNTKIDILNSDFRKKDKFKALTINDLFDYLEVSLND